MAYINPIVFDNGLAALADANRLDICRTQPTTFTEATSTFSMGNKVGISVSAPGEMVTPPGRKVTVSEVLDGVTTATSTGTSDDVEYWAISDTANSRLLAVGMLAAADLVTSGDGFTLPAFDIGIPYPAL